MPTDNKSWREGGEGGGEGKQKFLTLVKAIISLLIIFLQFTDMII
jgi:hypothetical protein